VNKLIKQKSVLLFIAIFQVVCFFQVTSIIHLHHTHNADGSQIALSFHPVYCHTPNHNGHHPDDDHHHDENNHHPGENHLNHDLTFVKSRLVKVHTLSTEFSFQSKVVSLTKPGFSNNVPSINCYIPLKSIFSSSVFSRSPPNLSC
jgi:hypothetical protein